MALDWRLMLCDETSPSDRQGIPQSQNSCLYVLDMSIYVQGKLTVYVKVIALSSPSAISKYYKVWPRFASAPMHMWLNFITVCYISNWSLVFQVYNNVFTTRHVEERNVRQQYSIRASAGRVIRDVSRVFITGESLLTTTVTVRDDIRGEWER